MENMNLKTLIHNWFDYKTEDEVNRPKKIEMWVKTYNKGEWKVTGIKKKEDCK